MSEREHPHWWRLPRVEQALSENQRIREVLTVILCRKVFKTSLFHRKVFNFMLSFYQRIKTRVKTEV